MIVGGGRIISTRDDFLALMGVVYFSWKLRNDVIFNNKVVNVIDVTREIIEVCKFRMLYKLNTSSRRGRAMIRGM